MGPLYSITEYEERILAIAVLMKTVRMLDTHEEIIGLSGHLLAVSRKKINKEEEYL
jgi:hypothetical protein